MTDETLRKARELKNEIEELESIVGGLSYRKRAADRDERPSRLPWWILRALNRKSTPESSEEAHIIIFDNVHTHGTDIKVDEDLLNLLIEYFKSRQAEKEKEFDALV